MIELINHLLLTDFPSGSSINYHQDKLYLIGDDANTILIMDCDYNDQKTIRVFDYVDKRIPKSEKADYETSAIVKVEGKECLIVLGSASKKNRRKGILVELENHDNIEEIDFGQFTKRIKKEGVDNINLEGCAALGDHFLFSNRANDTNPVNHLIVTSSGFWINQNDVPIHILDIGLPDDNQEIRGVSELFYVESKDVLLLTLSSEVTNNAYDDGAIGDSYIGWIDSISTKIHQPNLSLNGMLNLTNCNDAFKGEKIEGICVERVEENAITLHLASDNDQGTTRLFKVRMFIDQPASLIYPQHTHGS